MLLQRIRVPPAASRANREQAGKAAPLPQCSVTVIWLSILHRAELLFGTHLGPPFTPTRWFPIKFLRTRTTRSVCSVGASLSRVTSIF